MGMVKMTSQSEALVRSGKLATARGHAETFPSVAGIAPLRPDPVRGFWFLRKPAFVPVRTIRAPGAASGRTGAAAAADDVSIERYLRESPLVKAAFKNGERLTVLHDLATEASGIITIGVNMPASATREAVLSQRVELLVWGTLKHTERPVQVDVRVSDCLLHPTAASPREKTASDAPLEGQVALGIPLSGFYCGHPASLVYLTLTHCDQSYLGRIDWSALATQAARDYMPPASTSSSGALESPEGEAGLRVIGGADDVFSQSRQLDVPRMMVNLAGVTVKPADAEPFEASEPPRFRRLLFAKPPVGDIDSMKRARRRILV
jgi:hypothetical protein